jgi:hypothetical protein
MNVIFSSSFELEYDSISAEEQDKVDDFREHVQKYGLTGLVGRNKKSDDIPTGNNQDALIKYVQDNKIWHYHIGLPEYNKSKGIGRYVSDVILFYRRFPDSIKIIKLASHSPFKLPTEETLESLK